MNRKSLFGRLATSTMVRTAAERPDYFRTRLEPLEDRKLLATIYYNDDWVDANGGDLEDGDSVSHATDFGGGGISGLTYGLDAFGKKAGAGANEFPFIHNAINDDDVVAGDEILIAEGTHEESDITVSKPLSIQGFDGNLIVPETPSAATSGDFTAGTHSAFIIYSPSVSITNVDIDGSAGTVSGSLNYHHGITTLYTAPGGEFVTVRGQTLTLFQLGPEGEHGPNESVPAILVDGVSVSNTYWHGITFSALADKTFHDGGGDAIDQKNLTIKNSTVTNVGNTPDADRIGILIQNLVSATGTELANLISNTISNVGVGVKAAPYGTESLFYQDGDGLIEFNNREDYPNNNGEVVLTKVFNAAVYAFENLWGTSDTWAGNQALSGSASATGYYSRHSNGSNQGFISEGYGIGLHAQDIRLGSIDAESPWAKWRFGGTWEADDVVQMVLGGQTVSIAAGSTTTTTVIDNLVTALNSGGAPANFQDITWSRTDNDLYGKADLIDGTVNSALTTTELGGGASDDQTVSGRVAIGADDVTASLLAGAHFTGPGTGSSGSVGLLVDNDSGVNNSSDFFLSTGITFTNFETGVKVVQNVAPGNARQNLLFVDRTEISGNLVDLEIGTRSILSGASDLIENIVFTGSTLDPRFANNARDPWFYNNRSTPQLNSDNPSAPIVAPDRADTFAATNVTLTSSTTFSPLITGETGTTAVQNFNAAQSYLSVLLPLENYNGVFNSNQGTPFGALTSYNGLVSQDGTGQVVLGGTATNGYGASAFYGFNLASTSWSGNVNDPTFYYMDSSDLTGRSFINVKMKLEADTEAEVILFGLGDTRGNLGLWGINTAILNTSTYTTVQINLLSPVIELLSHEEEYISGSGNVEDQGVDLSKITGYLFAGDQGLINGNQDIPLTFRVDEVSAVSQKNSQVRVTGTINLNDAILAPEVRAGFDPPGSEVYTIVNNVGGTVLGSFAGLADGATVNAGGKLFILDYDGGTGDDVTLTRINPGLITGRHLFYNQSSFDGNSAALGIADDGAIATDKTAYLPGDGVAGFQSVSSYSRGMVGIMVDIGGGGSHASITTADFVFKVGNNNSPDTWAAAPAPSSLVVRTGAGVSGADRVEIAWATNAIANQWLEVQVLATANTGLADADVHFWASKRGDSGTASPATVFQTTTADAAQVFAFLTGVAPIDNIRDYNRSGSVTTADAAQVFNNLGTIVRINIGSGGPFAPEGDGGGDAGIASALAGAGSSGGDSGGSGWVASSLASASSSSAPVAAAVASLTEADSPSTGGDDDVDDSVLDDLLADLAAG